MLVVVHSRPKADTPQEAAFHVVVTGQVDTRLLQVDSDEFFFYRLSWQWRHRLFLMVVTGHAVVAVEAADGEADESVVAEEGDAKGATAGLAVGILGNPEGFLFARCLTAFGFFKLSQRLRLRISRNFDIVGGAIEVVGAESEAAGTELGAKRAITDSGRRIGPQGQAGIEVLFERLANKAGIDDIDEPAGGAAAVQKCGRATHDFDALRQQAFNGHLVVFAERRRIERVETVGKHPNALAKLTANHRA